MPFIPFGFSGLGVRDLLPPMIVGEFKLGTIPGWSGLHNELRMKPFIGLFCALVMVLGAFVVSNGVPSGTAKRSKSG